jgi:plastocyanin
MIIERARGGSGIRSHLKGQSATLTFADAGVFDYICALHPSMKGSVEVKR